MKATRDAAELHTATLQTRAFWSILLAIPTTSALLAGSIAFLYIASSRDEPISSADWYGAAIFSILPLVVLLMAGRTTWLLHRHRVPLTRRTLILRLMPILFVLGTLGGGLFVRHADQTREAISRDLAASLCSRLLGDAATPAALDACIPHALVCDRIERAKPPPDSRAGYFVPEFADRPEVRCVAAALAAAPPQP